MRAGHSGWGQTEAPRGRPLKLAHRCHMLSRLGVLRYLGLGSQGTGKADMSTGQEKVTTRVFGALDRVWTTACWPLIGLLNLFFRPDPQTGNVALWKVALWLAANAAILYAAVVSLNTQPLFWTLTAFLVVHILIIAGSLRIMYEEKRVMEGSMAADKMTFSALDAVNNVPILASSTAFYVLGLAALIQTVEHTGWRRSCATARRSTASTASTSHASSTKCRS